MTGSDTNKKRHAQCEDNQHDHDNFDSSKCQKAAA